MKKIISPLLLLVAAMLWGFSFVAQKATVIIPTFTLLFLRSIIAVMFLFPTVAAFDRISSSKRKILSFKPFRIGITKTELFGGALCGLFLFAASALQQAGIAGTDAGKTSFITALYVVIVPIYSVFLGKKVPFPAWAGVALATVGFYLLCVNGDFRLSPSDTLVFMCAFVFAMQISAVDFLLAKCDAVRLSLVQFIAVSALSLISSFIFEAPAPIDDIISVLPEILFLGIASSTVAYTLQIIGQKNTPPAMASIILSLESVFGATFSAIMLSERMTAKEYIGCAAVLIAVVIAQINPNAKPYAKREE